MAKGRKASLTVIILAAGKGVRMKSALPKVLHPVGGLPVLRHVIHAAETLHPQRIVVVAGRGMDDVARAAAPHAVAIQDPPRGTGDAVMAALGALPKNLSGDVLILLGDMPLVTPATLKALVAARRSGARTGLSVLGAEVANPAGYGRLVADTQGVVKKIVEHKDASAAERAIDLINTGAFCVDGAQLRSWVGKIGSRNAQKEYYITDLPAIAAKDGYETRLCLLADPDEAMGGNARLDLARIEAAFQDRRRFEILESGVTLADPGSVYFSWDTKIAADVTVEPCVVFGPGVQIESGAQIRAFSYLEGVRVGKGASVGPFARLRPDTVIGAKAKIGNFVEIKKSRIGAGARINHLAYVGDTVMDEDVNFSCGAITVNYDGFAKHKTVIGKGVMVGSNVNLVAPVTIGEGAFLAAGSTVTADVPKDALAIGREKTGIRKGWAGEYRKRRKTAGRTGRKTKS